MLVDLEKLKKLGYEKINGETYGKKVNDFYTKIVQVKLNTNVIVSRYLKTSKLSIVHSDQIKELIKYYKELSEDYKSCVMEEKANILSQSDKNYLQIIINQSTENQISYIAIIFRHNARYLRIRYGMSKMYSYNPMQKGFEGLKVDKNYTLKELGL